MIIVLILIIAAVCGFIANSKGRNAGLWFAAGLLFSLLTLIIIACLPHVDAVAATAKACPDCGEPVLASARLCRFCRHEFADEPLVAAPVVKPTIWQKLFWNPHVGQ